MGYTHYFAYDPNADSFVQTWPQMVTDAALIATHVEESLGVRLAGGFGDGAPELSERRIWLNGTRSGDLHHETLLIDPAPRKTCDEHEPQELPDLTRCDLARFEDRAFLTGFCKTARKPYDIAVTSILLRCRHLAPDAFVIDSDGAWELEWQSGAMHWQPSCVTGAAPVEVVALLFGQAETRENTRLLAGLHLQPRCLQSDAAQPPPAPVDSPEAV